MANPPMYNVASAVLYRTLAIVRSLPLPGCEETTTEIAKLFKQRYRYHSNRKAFFKILPRTPEVDCYIQY